VSASNQEGEFMSAEDKMKNQAQNLKGEAKEKFGDVTGDDSLQAEGQADQSKSDLKQAGEKVKDAFKD